MNFRNINTYKDLKIYFLLLSTLINCYLVWLVSSDFNKGFNLVDESYYLNLYSNPFSENFPFSYFHYIGSIIFKIAQENIIILRYLGFLILILSSILFCITLLKIKLLAKEGSLIHYLLILVSIISMNNYYGIYLSTPSYNLFNISLILVFVSLTFLRFLYLKKDNFILNFFLSLSFFLLTINKFSSAILIFIFLILLFYKTISKKLIIHFILFNLLISLIFLYFEYEKINLILNFMFLEQDYVLFKNHDLPSQIINNFSDLYTRLTISNLRYYFLIFLILSILLKSNLNVFIIFFIFSEFLIFYDNGGGLSLSTVYLFLYNILLFLIFKKKIYLKNSFFLFFAYFLCICFWLG